MIELAGSARNKATLATSEGSTRRPIGMAAHLALIISAGIGPSGIPANLRNKGVSPDVGQIVLNLSWSLANSRAKDLVAAETPALVALYHVCVAPGRMAFSLEITMVEPGPFFFISGMRTFDPR